MSDLQPPEQPLDVLPDMVNLVLIQTGEVFRSRSLHDPNALGNTREMLKKIIPKANERFHEALDEIELEILQAKAIMERDLATIRARHAERERAAGAARMLQASPDAKGPPTRVGGALSPSRPSPVAMSDVENQDIIMSEEASKTDLNGSNPRGEDSFELSAGRSNPVEAPTDAKLTPLVNIAGLAPSANAQATTTETKQESSNGHPTAIQVPTSAELQDADFESMFNDVEGADADNDINFDLDFSADANMGQDLINANAFGNITNTNNGLIDLNAASNEGINTLLPGLENYVHDGEDFTMLDIPPATTLPAGAVLPPATKAGNNNVAEAGADAPPVESNFDDMFYGSGDFSMGGAEDSDMGDDGIGDFGDFDEAWFKAEEK
ncbi:hypothetical protein LPUS_09758 [Lasallia pustulata]|uniref:Uncharacterized protein n=1 Tax=Lasallia pustulata TaxID=136370 RepID=A0A1W5D8L6_9LECA|nr:hypothetical protein LPUS_09758 [Lasallia pustulata]